MKSAIILHGMPSKEEYLDASFPSPSNQHWIPWIQKHLLINGYIVQTPELPEPYLPVYEEWKKVFQQFNLNEDTTLVGHSCGAGFLIRWLSENKIKVGKVALVAPWIDPNKDELPNGFFNFTIDKDLVSRTEGTCVFVSSDDEKMILKSVKIISNELPQAELNNFDNKGHFTFGDMKTEKFPELLDYLLR